MGPEKVKYNKRESKLDGLSSHPQKVADRFWNKAFNPNSTQSLFIVLVVKKVKSVDLASTLKLLNTSRWM